MDNAKINYNGEDYNVVYTIKHYLFGNREEKTEHILTFRRYQFKGKTLEDAIKKFTKFLEKRN